MNVENEFKCVIERVCVCGCLLVGFFFNFFA